MGAIRIRVPLLAVLLASLAAPGQGASQIVVGRLVDETTSFPLGSTSLMLLDSTGAAVDVALSDSSGWFALGAREPGTYRIFVAPLAYAELLTPGLEIADGGTVEVELRVTPSPVELEGLVVSTERRRIRLEKEGFYRRRDLGTGYYMDEEEIRKRNPTYTTDLFRMMPGARVQSVMSEYGYAVTFRGIGALTRCQPLYVLDGWPLELGSFTIDGLVSPGQIIALEVYPRGIGAPARYRMLGSQCGIVVVWTR